MKIQLPAIFIWLTFPVVLLAQAEHVPVNHPVYDFLGRMNVKGEISRYSRAVLPMERKEVTEYIRDLSDARARMTSTEQSLLARYQDEFVAEADGTQDPVILFSGNKPFIETLFGDSFSDREKFLYAWKSGDRGTTIFMEFIGTSELRNSLQDGSSASVWVGQFGGQFRGTIGGILGYGLRSTNGTTAGSRDVALTEQVLRQNANYGDWKNNFFDVTEAYLSGSWSWGNLSLGKQSVLYGNGIGNRVLVSLNSPPFDALRLNVRVGDFRFAFLHGFLLADHDTLRGGRPFFENKYLVIHRAEVDILNSIRLGVFEGVIYSQRQIDFSYLNPINFYKSAEHAGGDRDNPMLGFDIQTIGLQGSELYGSWTIDDVDFSKWGTGWWGNKFVWQAGVINHSLLPNTELGLEYSRVEPWTYSHTFRNNEYTNKNTSIGFEIPPNSDEWLFRLRHWIGNNLSLFGAYQIRRHGRDVQDENSVVIRRFGGDINAHYEWGRDDLNAPFLAGVRETQQIATVSARFEPFRNLVFDATYRFRKTDIANTGSTSDHLISFLLEVIY